MEVDGRNMDENIISSTSDITAVTTTPMMTQVIHELINNDEETRDERIGSEEVRDEVTHSITLFSMSNSFESMNNAAPEGTKFYNIIKGEMC